MRKVLRSLPFGAYVFISIFLLRLIVLARLTASPFLIPSRGDMHFYDEWAQRILEGQLTEHQAFYGLPLYPYLLAFLYKIFGYSPFIPGFLQALLDAGTALILYKLGARLFSDKREIQRPLSPCCWNSQSCLRSSPTLPKNVSGFSEDGKARP